MPYLVYNRGTNDFPPTSFSIEWNLMQIVKGQIVEGVLLHKPSAYIKCTAGT